MKITGSTVKRLIDNKNKILKARKFKEDEKDRRR